MISPADLIALAVASLKYDADESEKDGFEDTRARAADLREAIELVKRVPEVVVLDHPAVVAWCRWYSARLDRIIAGSDEDYTGYEQDLFEVFQCRGVEGPKP
jgi:hypothetical protein